MKYCYKLIDVILTQFTTGGNNDAEIATPINGPAAPKSNATATPEPEVRAHGSAIHNERAFPLKYNQKKNDQILILLSNQLYAAF